MYQCSGSFNYQFHLHRVFMHMLPLAWPVRTQSRKPRGGCRSPPRRATRRIRAGQSLGGNKSEMVGPNGEGVRKRTMGKGVGVRDKELGRRMNYGCECV